MQMDHLSCKKTFFEAVDATVAEQDPAQRMLLLESGHSDSSASRLSMLASDPEVEMMATAGYVTTIVNGQRQDFSADPWETFQNLRRKYPGWYFGYFGYDLKNSVENLISKNSDLTGAPDIHFFRPGRLTIYKPDETTSSGIQPVPYGESESEAVFRTGPFSFRTSKESYISRIKKALALIREGEFYEINLSHVLQADFSGDPYRFYRTMLTGNPVPFASYFSGGGVSVCSASPERFLYKRGNCLVSQPIKGTAPKYSDPALDSEIKKQLKNSEKERSENLMIVDLVRHDFSRVCLPGSVIVPKLFDLQSFETVHQLVSTIEGQVDLSFDPVDIIKNCFPMGSMTGAPKIRSMEFIEKLEDYKRGIYSGAIGYITPDGDFDFSVVIRTAIISGNRLIYPVGGAITSDSEPELEWEETLVKARTLPGFTRKPKEMADGTL